MTTSEHINEIAAALAKAQGQMENATLNKINPHFKSKYADLAEIRDTVIPALSAHGIAVVQTLDAERVLTRLLHTSGQWIESLCPIPAGADMQKMGSAITYARRYSLSAICGISAGEDDDGNEAATIAKPALVEPPNYRDWRDDLAATADTGTAALQEAWVKSDAALRHYLTVTDNTWWNALKTRAAKVKA